MRASAIWQGLSFRDMEWRMVPILLALMWISLLILSATDPAFMFDPASDTLFTPKVIKQIHHFAIGWAVYFLFAGCNYHLLREWAWVLYAIMILALLGLFCVPAIQNVHRWYRIPFIGGSIQPSEYAKLILMIGLSWFLDRERHMDFRTTCKASVVILLPFLLILKQPDLGTALVLGPISAALLYLGGGHPKFVKWMTIGGAMILLTMLLIFSGLFPHETMRPFATRFLKEYQYERLNPENHHQWAAATAIGVGGWRGSGWRNSEFTGRGWLPYGYTDSVFPAFGEEFGFLGLFLLMALFYALIALGFRISLQAKDRFGQMLAAGISVYIAMHCIVNIGMMCHLLPITGVPLLLISYGGSSIFVTMAALGILQSIHSRRFVF